MRFNTRVAGIPCQCEAYYTPGRPMVITGSGFGDAEPPEPDEFEWQLYDRRGRRAEWLEDKVTGNIEDELRQQCIETRSTP